MPPVLYEGERGIALDPIQESRASSPVDLGYTEQFHIPLVTSLAFESFVGCLGSLWSSIKQIKAPYVFD